MASKTPLTARRRFARLACICGLFLLSAAFAAMPVAADKHGGGSNSGKSGDKVEMNDNHGANRGPGNAGDANRGPGKVDDDMNEDANEHQGMVDNDANEHQGAVNHDANDNDDAVENEPNDNDDDDMPTTVVTTPTG